METYAGFAEVYDLFMEEVPYKKWAALLNDILKKNGIEKELVLELGCGTGNITQLLAGYGYDMIGIDNSEEMLMQAMKKKEEKEYDILYLLQDMREFELYGTVKAVVSVCDSVNYILEKEELLEVFKLVNNYLDPEGLFIFDFNTEYKYKEQIGGSTIAENREEGSFIWENEYDADEKINEYVLTLFIRTEEELYKKYEEVHYQRAYTLEEMKRLIERAGMEFVEAFDGEIGNEPTDESERIYMIAKEKGKKNV